MAVKKKAAAKKKTAPKKKTATKPSRKAKTSSRPSADVRGGALVELVIAKLEEEGGILGGCGIPKHRAKGMAKAALAKLKLPDGKPLPPSLARFLAYDESYLGVLDGRGRLVFRTFNDLMKSEFDERTRDMYTEFGVLLPGKC